MQALLLVSANFAQPRPKLYSVFCSVVYVSARKQGGCWTVVRLPVRAGTQCAGHSNNTSTGRKAVQERPLCTAPLPVQRWA